MGAHLRTALFHAPPRLVRRPFHCLASPSPHNASPPPSSTISDPLLRARYTVVFALCAMGGALLFARWVLSDLQSVPVSAQCATREWLRGAGGRWDGLHTYQGNFHLAWAIPMLEPSYFSPSVHLHCFLMFAPFVAMADRDMSLLAQGVLLFVTGPLLSTFITSNLQEQASIWCFFSIVQICVIALWPLLTAQPNNKPATKRKTK